MTRRMTAAAGGLSFLALILAVMAALAWLQAAPHVIQGYGISEPVSYLFATGIAFGAILGFPPAVEQAYLTATGYDNRTERETG